MPHEFDIPNAGWIGSLKHEDLRRLREVVRRVHMQHYPIDRCTDWECDRIIDGLGPDVAMKELKKCIDAGVSG